jgi:hypothetical protein
MNRDIPTAGDHPEDAQGLLDVVLPGFCPAVYPFVRDCLSRTSRLKTKPEP